MWQVSLSEPMVTNSTESGTTNISRNPGCSSKVACDAKLAKWSIDGLCTHHHRVGTVVWRPFVCLTSHVSNVASAMCTDVSHIVTSPSSDPENSSNPSIERQLTASAWACRIVTGRH